MTSVEKIPSAYELFQRFAPKFREVKWKPSGFLKEHVAEKKDRHRFGFFPQNMNGVTFERYHGINISAAGADLDFLFKYDAKSNKTMSDQVFDACWEAILKGPFKDRRFFAFPAKGPFETSFEGWIHEGHAMPIVFSQEGATIPGLDLVTTMRVNDWGFFIPKHTPEGKIVDAAVQLEKAVRRKRKLREKEETWPTQESCEINLRAALTALAA